MEEIRIIYVWSQTVKDAQQKVVAVKLQTMANKNPLSDHKGMTAFRKVEASGNATLDAICQRASILPESYMS